MRSFEIRERERETEKRNLSFLLLLCHCRDTFVILSRRKDYFSSCTKTNKQAQLFYTSKIFILRKKKKIVLCFFSPPSDVHRIINTDVRLLARDIHLRKTRFNIQIFYLIIVVFFFLNILIIKTRKEVELYECFLT